MVDSIYKESRKSFTTFVYYFYILFNINNIKSLSSIMTQNESERNVRETGQVEHEVEQKTLSNEVGSNNDWFARLMNQSGHLDFYSNASRCEGVK